MATALSVIIPANNEAALIGGCLDAVAASDPLEAGAEVQVIVAANGCTDATAEIALGYGAAFAAKGWQLDVLNLPEGGKLAALDAADAVATSDARAYLDADVLISPALLAQTVNALDCPAPRYVSGQVILSNSPSWLTRAYGRFYIQVPFMQQTAPGCGYFAMNASGRAQWGKWPRIISDDTFARLSFTSEQRIEVAASYSWPLVEGLSNLIRVRRRQNAGVAEIQQMFPRLVENDSKAVFSFGAVLRAILRAPLGFVVYGCVALCVKLTPGSTSDWRRGR